MGNACSCSPNFLIVRSFKPFNESITHRLVDYPQAKFHNCIPIATYGILLL